MNKNNYTLQHLKEKFYERILLVISRHLIVKVYIIISTVSLEITLIHATTLLN